MEPSIISDFFSKITSQAEEAKLSFDPIWRLRGLLDHSSRLLDKLATRKPQRDNNIVGHLIQDFQLLSTKLFTILLELQNDPVSEEKSDLQTGKSQQLVNKLARELQYIESLANAAQENEFYYSTTDGNNLSWFYNIVHLAANDLDVDLGNLLVLFNLQQFLGLRSFIYTREFRILDIPVTVMYTPWEWSVIWHEIAGIKVKEITQGDPDFFTSVLGEIQSKVSSPSSWTKDYLEEIYEDASSIMVFGAEFIPIFEKILRRTYLEPISKDSRHPPVDLRIKLGKLLLDQDAPDATADEKTAAVVIKNRFAEYLPIQRGSFEQDDSHTAIMNAIVKYQADASKGFEIFDEARSAFKGATIDLPVVTRTAKQVDLRTKKTPVDPNMVSIEIGNTHVEIFNKFSTNENKVDSLLNFSFSESDFMSPAEHSDDSVHSKNVTVVFESSHGRHSYTHKH